MSEFSAFAGAAAGAASCAIAADAEKAPIVPLGDQCADDAELNAAAGARLAPRMNGLLDPLEWRTGRPQSVSRARGAAGWSSVASTPARARDHRCVELLERERQLVRVKLLGFCAGPVPLGCGGAAYRSNS